MGATVSHIGRKLGFKKGSVKCGLRDKSGFKVPYTLPRYWHYLCAKFGENLFKSLDVIVTLSNFTFSY